MKVHLSARNVCATKKALMFDFSLWLKKVLLPTFLAVDFHESFHFISRLGEGYNWLQCHFTLIFSLFCYLLYNKLYRKRLSIINGRGCLFRGGVYMFTQHY